MAVSKRLRFEILKRDNHTCRYCGATAPEAALTVDHVMPVALGGTDLPENLVAACRDCNAGKSSVPAGAPLVADVAADALRWSRAVLAASEVLAADRALRRERRAEFQELWNEWTFKLRGMMNQNWPLPGDWGSTVDSMIQASATVEDFAEAIESALGRGGIDDRWRYFCGVMWKIISRKQAMAREILSAEDASS